MQNGIRNKGMMLSLVTAALLVVTACRSSDSSVVMAGSGQSSAGAISGPPEMNAAFGTRDARKCNKVTHVPSVAEATVLVQCANEGYMQSGNDLILVTGVTVEMGGSRKMNYTDTFINDLDAGGAIYPLRGHMTRYDCGKQEFYGVGTNCQVWSPTDAEVGTGRCWHTTFGEWRCDMNGWGQRYEVKKPGPTNY